MKQSLFALLLFGWVCGVIAQEAKPLIGFTPFVTDGISAEESRLIETLVQSYLAEMGELIAVREQEPDSPGQSAHRPPDYTIGGHIRLGHDGHLFLLEIVDTRTGEVYRASSVYKSTGELALKARSILEAAFSGSVEPERSEVEAAQAERIDESQIIGTWKGEAGVEMIYLQRGGRGVAIFSSGAQMVLAWAIEDNTLKVWQVSPNTEWFYYPLPRDVARRLAEGAQPIHWELSLYKRGTILEGVKLATAVRMENNSVVELIPGGDVRQVQWSKTTH